MLRLFGLSPWERTVSSHLPHLTRPQCRGLVWWSIGIVLAQSCGLTTVAAVLAYLLDRREMTVREYLRDWYREKASKRGAKHGVKRQELEVTTCFGPLLRWVVRLLPPTSRRLALAMDASTLGQRFTILSIHVVLNGCAIPIAWKVVGATQKGAWRPHWEALFGHLQGRVPSDWMVVVAADRGLYAPWLYQTITELGWHPLLRINRQGQYCPFGSETFRPLSQVVTKGGKPWAGTVICFKTANRQIVGTLLARWDRKYRDPWLILTDLPPAQASVAWYGMRAWIEASYKDSKRGGWHWEQTKMTNPHRAERLWLAMAVAMLWVISVGNHAEATTPKADRVALPTRHIAHTQARPTSSPPRSLSHFRRGRLVIVVALCLGLPVPTGRLHPDPWPESLDTSFDLPIPARSRQKAA